MDIPGERLLIKLWETITEKGIGNLLQPWQERRVGLTRIEMKKKEIIAIAEAEKLAEAIRQNDIQFENPLLLNFKDKHGDRIEPSFAIQQLCFNANKNTINDTIRKEINLSKGRFSLYVLVNIFIPPDNHDFASSRRCSFTLNQAK